jgi:hypothetical protein
MQPPPNPSSSHAAATGSVLLRFVALLGWGGLVAVLLVSSTQKKSLQAELERSRESARKAAEPGSPVAKPQKSATTAGEDVEKLKREAEDVHRLRNEVRQLRDGQKELEQLKVQHQQLQTAIQQMQQVQTENAQLKATTRAYEQAQSATLQASRRGACIANLRQMDGATQQWALENRKAVQSPVLVDQIALYLKGGKLPVCPEGGVYTHSIVGTPPKCSIPGHALQ